jgi:hypothetical protein
MEYYNDQNHNDLIWFQNKNITYNKKYVCCLYIKSKGRLNKTWLSIINSKCDICKLKYNIVCKNMELLKKLSKEFGVKMYNDAGSDLLDESVLRRGLECLKSDCLW